MQSGTTLTMTEELQEQLLSHARDSLPCEAVGLLGGTADGQVMLVMPLPNIASGTRAFWADPFAQFSALRRLRSENLQLLAIYHSHPNGGIDPSADDVAYAKQWPCAHLIVALGTDPNPSVRLRAFCCGRNDSVVDVEISVPPQSQSVPSHAR